MRLEIAQRKREAVVDADQRGRILGQPLHQPFGDAASGPVFARARRRRNLDRRRIALGQIDAQALQAGGRRFRARIVDADVCGRRRASHATALKRSKRNASRSRSGRSLSRLGKWIVPPLSRFRASSIGPSFCPSSRSRHMQPVVRVDADQMSVEGGVMDFR